MSDKDIFDGLSFASELKQVEIDGLRAHVEAGTWKIGSPFKHGEAIEVVRRFDASKAEAVSAKRDAREEETLAIAKEANRIASEARTAAFEQARWAKWAAIIATVAAIIATAAAMAGK